MGKGFVVNSVDESGNTEEYLSRFKICKDELYDLVSRLEENAKACSEFICSLDNFNEIIELYETLKERKYDGGENIDFVSEMKHINEASQKVIKIKEVIQRDHMKVVFLGHTSNGKSTVINSLLGGKVLPIGFGHTTNCFVCVKGTEEKCGFLLAPNGEGSLEKKDVKSVKQIANALCQIEKAKGDGTNDFKANEDAGVIQLHWPISQCSLLRQGVVLVDSPGMDMTSDYDHWIDSHCLDADLFVLVANAESTLKLSERKFFIRVKDKISKPNVFILYNRWDCSDPGEEDESESEEAAEELNGNSVVENVRKQHLQNCIDFMAEDLKIACSADEAEKLVRQRVFFISGKEALSRRTGSFMRMENGIQLRSDDRYEEFKNFEKGFGKCLSESAIKTRFEHHSVAAIDITLTAKELLSSVEKKLTMLRDAGMEAEKDLLMTKEMLSEESMVLKESISSTVNSFRKSCRDRVVNELHGVFETSLVNLVSSFKFSDTFAHSSWPDFCAELDLYLEDKINLEINASLSSRLAAEYDETILGIYKHIEKTFIADEMLKMDYELAVQSNSSDGRKSGSDLMKLYLNCNQLSGNFRPDLTFRFSLGLATN